MVIVPFAVDIVPESRKTPLVKRGQINEAMAQPEPSSDPTTGSNALTVVLGVAIVVVALLLGLALGWRGAIARWRAAAPNPSVPNTQLAPVVASTEHSFSETATAATPGENSGDSAGSMQGPLVVTQNGRVIFRLADEDGLDPAAASGLNPSAGAMSSRSSTSSLSSNGRLIHRVEPQYPEEARARHLEGAVLLEAQIGRDGTVHNISVLEGEPILADAAVEAVRQWRYRPYFLKGKPVEMQGRITIRFKLPPS